MSTPRPEAHGITNTDDVFCFHPKNGLQCWLCRLLSSSSDLLGRLIGISSVPENSFPSIHASTKGGGLWYQIGFSCHSLVSLGFRST